jgi:hypothetical protein
MSVYGDAEIFESHNFKRADFNHAGVVNKYVNSPVVVMNCRYHFFYVRTLSHIAFNRKNLSRARLQIIARPVQLLLIPSANHQSGALLCKFTRQHQTQAPGSAYNRDDFASQVKRAHAADNGSQDESASC